MHEGAHWARPCHRSTQARKHLNYLLMPDQHARLRRELILLQSLPAVRQRAVHRPVSFSRAAGQRPVSARHLPQLERAESLEIGKQAVLGLLNSDFPDNTVSKLLVVKTSGGCVRGFLSTPVLLQHAYTLHIP